jgi:hypothetical protein
MNKRRTMIKPRIAEAAARAHPHWDVLPAAVWRERRANPALIRLRSSKPGSRKTILKRSRSFGPKPRSLSRRCSAKPTTDQSDGPAPLPKSSPPTVTRTSSASALDAES